MLAVQLAFSQFPYGILPIIVGWVVGNAWGVEFLPSVIVRWRVPRWVVGEDAQWKGGSRGQYQGMRRRLEEENQDGMREVSSGMARSPAQDDRRGFLGGVGRYFTSGS